MVDANIKEKAKALLEYYETTGDVHYVIEEIDNDPRLRERFIDYILKKARDELIQYKISELISYRYGYGFNISFDIHELIYQFLKDINR